MILYVKGANFADSNIGQINTLAVRKHIAGGGATYEIPNYITRGESPTWDITLADGYEFGSYVIKVGGVDVTNDVVTINESVMAISLSNVSGNVDIDIQVEITA